MALRRRHGSYIIDMSVNLDDFKTLSIAERIQLVEDIWDSIAADAPSSFRLSEAEKNELNRRVEAHHADSSTSVPWEQVREKLFHRSV